MNKYSYVALAVTVSALSMMASPVIADHHHAFKYSPENKRVSGVHNDRNYDAESGSADLQLKANDTHIKKSALSYIQHYPINTNSPDVK